MTPKNNEPYYWVMQSSEIRHGDNKPYRFTFMPCNVGGRKLKYGFTVKTSSHREAMGLSGLANNLFPLHQFANHKYRNQL